MRSLAQETNDRLFYAQNLLECYGQSDDPRAQKALDYAVWLCLRSTWIAWLQEVAEYAGLAPGSISRFRHLLQDEGQQHATVQHLINLKSSPDSWLSQLLERIDGDDVLILQQRRVETATQSAPEGLSLKNLDVQNDVDDIERLEGVLAGFKDYIRFTREQQQEW